MKDTNETAYSEDYNDSEISSSIISAIGNAEQVIDLLIGRSRKKAQEEAEQALKEYQARIKQIASGIMDNVSAGSIRISESIDLAIKRKVEKEISGLSSNFITNNTKKAEESTTDLSAEATDSLQPKDISKIDYELAKAAAELKDKTNKLNKAADTESGDKPNNNGRKSSGELKKARKENTQETPPDNNDDKVEDIIRFFS